MSSLAVAVELRSASPMYDREEMLEVVDAFQRTAPKGVDPFVHDRNLAHAHADVWLWRFPASRPCERNLDLCQADCVDLDRRTGRDDRVDCEIGCAPTHGSCQSGMTL